MNQWRVSSIRSWVSPDSYTKTSGWLSRIKKWMAFAAVVAWNSATATAIVDRSAYDWNTAGGSSASIAWTIQQTRPNWMSALPDATPLGALSLPGTHDSLARFNTYFEREWGIPTPDFSRFGATQWMTVGQQLSVGVRFLDLRFRHVNNDLAAHHGQVFQGVWVNDVFTVLQNFLRVNPSETVVVRVREEYSESGNSRSFAATVTAALTRFPGLFWTGASKGRMPTLGEVRGKAVMLQNFNVMNDATVPLGLGYGSFANIQDDYDVPFLASLVSKWKSVENFAEQARRDVMQQDKKFYINFLSGSGYYLSWLGSSFMPPWQVASGQSSAQNGSSFMRVPRYWGSTVLEYFPSICWPSNGYCVDDYIGTNLLFLSWVRQMQPAFVGIVPSDFPGPGLIQAIIDTNQRWAAIKYRSAVVTPSVTSPVDVRTGPIWSNADAQGKCPNVCMGVGRRWNLNWMTVVPGQISVCGCQ